MSIIKSLAEFIVFSNLWIALCASGLTINTYLVLNREINLQVILLVFLSTFSVYNLQRIVKHYLQKKNYSPRHSWIFKNNLIISFFVVASSVAAIIIFFKIYSLTHFIYLLPFSLASILYAFTLFSKKRALRDLPFLKIFLIAITWAVSSVFLPFIELDLIMDRSIIALFVFNLLYIISISIPFDIRDLKLDHQDTKTIPQVFGVSKAIKISCLILIVCVLIIIYTSQAIFVIPLAVVFVLISMTKKEMPELFYSGILDGTILLFPLISFIFN